MSFWSIESLRSALGASFLVRPRAATAIAPAIAEKVSIDSRDITPGCVFIAIKGEKTDGHRYLAGALAGGASVLVVHDAASIDGLSLPAHVAVLQVSDTADGLLRLAAAYRRTLDKTRVIAVGGSNGKTTTCKLLHSVLSASLRGTASPKSFNNAIGVPLTILSARRTDQYLICEIGTNAPGEIAPLAAVIEPDIAVITSIGREHLEGLGGLAGVVAEEASLIPSLRAGGTAIVTADSPLLLETLRPAFAPKATAAQPRTLLTFGVSPAADLRVTNVDVTESSTSFSLNQRDRFSVPMPGAHNACNAAAVIAVARKLGLTAQAIEASLAVAKGPEMRMHRTTSAGVQFINDAYNANPDSTLAAIATFRQAFAKAPGVTRRVLVLGDMLELGAAGPDMHREVGEAVAAAACFDLVVLVGPLCLFAAERISKSAPGLSLMPFADAAEANAHAIAALFRPGDAVLLKASRGTGLERILKAHQAQPVSA
jgi:UDP-N-acetylmuramoyl-tripeptide--D-alanyl-D-alanine ligase